MKSLVIYFSHTGENNKNLNKNQGDYEIRKNYVMR